MTIPAVKLINITKRFPGVVANDKVNFEVLPGEIHALLGENGAGKSTLINILAGLYKPDEGSIELNGKTVEFKGPLDAIAQGIGVVFQHFKLVPNQTVAENIALGLRPRPFLLSLGKLQREVSELGEKLGLVVHPAARVNTLSVGEQQRVEIVKALYLGAKILALDEPTANLTPQESEGLFKAVRDLAQKGYAIIFISHKLNEVLALAHRATILRAGKSVATLSLQEKNVTKEDLANLMIGREAGGEIADELGLASAPHLTKHGTATLLQVEELEAANDSGQTVLKQISFEARRGEITGIVGVAGNGQRELTEAITGLRKNSAGKIWLDGGRLDGQNPRTIRERGVAFVPEDRLALGSAPGLNLEDNYLLQHYWRPNMRRGPFIRREVANSALAQAISQYEIKVGDPFAPARLLSGGNLQKLLLARELASNPDLLIVANPTRGLDIGASAYVHDRLREARDKGAAVLLILEDLDEALTLADRLLVMYEGRITGERPPERTAENLQQIGLLMAGVAAEETQL